MKIVGIVYRRGRSVCKSGDVPGYRDLAGCALCSKKLGALVT